MVEIDIRTASMPFCRNGRDPFNRSNTSLTRPNEMVRSREAVLTIISFFSFVTLIFVYIMRKWLARRKLSSRDRYVLCF